MGLGGVARPDTIGVLSETLFVAAAKRFVAVGSLICFTGACFRYDLGALRETGVAQIRSAGLFDSEAQFVCGEELLAFQGDFRVVVATARFFVADFTEICETISPSALVGHGYISRLWNRLGCLGRLSLRLYVLPSQEWLKEKAGVTCRGRSPASTLILERMCGNINGRMSGPWERTPPSLLGRALAWETDRKLCHNLSLCLMDSIAVI